eukprot:1138048-Pelagomonas_calceolata.AAC.1
MHVQSGQQPEADIHVGFTCALADFLTKGFEWTLLHGEPTNSPPHRYKIAPRLCCQAKRCLGCNGQVRHVPGCDGGKFLWVDVGCDGGRFLLFDVRCDGGNSLWVDVACDDGEFLWVDVGCDGGKFLWVHVGCDGGKFLWVDV